MKKTLKYLIISAMAMLFMALLATPISVYASHIRVYINGELLAIPEGAQPIVVYQRPFVAEVHMFIPLSVDFRGNFLPRKETRTPHNGEILQVRADAAGRRI